MSKAAADLFAQHHRHALAVSILRLGSVYGPGQGTGLLGAREMLRTKKGDELKSLQAKLRGPIARLDAVFNAAKPRSMSASALSSDRRPRLLGCE